VTGEGTAPGHTENEPVTSKGTAPGHTDSDPETGEGAANGHPDNGPETGEGKAPRHTENKPVNSKGTAPGHTDSEPETGEGAANGHPDNSPETGEDKARGHTARGPGKGTPDSRPDNEPETGEGTPPARASRDAGSGERAARSGEQTAASGEQAARSGERAPDGRTPARRRPVARLRVLGRPAGSRSSASRTAASRSLRFSAARFSPRQYSPATWWRRRLGRWRTRRLLEAHLLVLFLCAAVAATSLFLSCRQAQQGADALAAREAPAVQGLAATRLAALRSYQEAQFLVRTRLVDVAGSGETYRSQLSAADQGLSRIADRTDQDLGTVKGVLATYGNSLNLGTSLYRDPGLMQEQKLGEARSLLSRKGVGLAPRLDALQRTQLRHAEATAGMGRWQRAGWWIAELALGVLALTLGSALFVLRDRCGRDWNVCLLAAFALTVLLAVVPLLTASATEGDLDDALADLRHITTVSRQHGLHLADAEQGLSQLKQVRQRLVTAQQNVTQESEQVRQETAGDTWSEQVYRGTFVGGLLVVVLPALGLGLRLDGDYWRRR
jgi:hypothetical protein